MELAINPCLDPFEGKSVRGDLLYLRLHGRTGYCYTYSKAEMKELIEMGKTYPQAYLMFNNIRMYQDAHRLKKIIGEAELIFSPHPLWRAGKLIGKGWKIIHIMEVRKIWVPKRGIKEGRVCGLMES